MQNRQRLITEGGSCKLLGGWKLIEVSAAFRMLIIHQLKHNILKSNLLTEIQAKKALAEH